MTSNKITRLVLATVFACMALVITLKAQAQAPTPEFRLWIECVERSEHPGRAVAYIAYEYAGDTPITAEDSRFFGDTPLGDTEVFEFRIMPGEHLNDTRINVGALKVVVWKVVLFGKLHVVTAWDNPEMPDCLYLPGSPPEATEQPNA